MGDCTLWIKWFFLTECRQVSTHVKIGWASRSLNHSAGTNAKPCTWDRQTLWLLAQPEEQLCRQGPAKAWLSLSQSTALQQREPGMDPQQHRQLSQAAIPQLPVTTGTQHQGGICQYKTSGTGVRSGKGHCNTCPVRAGDAGLLQPAEQTALGWELQ